MTVVLLGPQNVESTVDGALRELGVRGPVGVVTAGWQEREDAALPSLAFEAVPLNLHARAEDVFQSDPEFEAVYKERQTHLRLMQELYRIRLDRADDAALAIGVRHVPPALLEAERSASVRMVRQLDRDHIERCSELYADFDARWPAAERPDVAKHRRELKQLVARTDALVIAGGHVAVLLNRMVLFDILGLAERRPLVAWSAGAMMLCEHIVLFHDDPPQGRGVAEVLGEGLAAVPNIVALPNPRARLRLDDRERVALLAQRFPDAACVAMDHGAKVVFEGGRPTRGKRLARLRTNGSIDTAWP